MIAYYLVLLLIILFVIHKQRQQCSRDPSYIKTLLRASARYAIAAMQDASIMIAVLHANYAAGYLWALNDIATTSEIEEIGGIDWNRFKDAITSIQDSATKRMSSACSEYHLLTDSSGGSAKYLTHIAGDI